MDSTAPTGKPSTPCVRPLLLPQLQYTFRVRCNLQFKERNWQDAELFMTNEPRDAFNQDSEPYTKLEGVLRFIAILAIMSF